MHQPAAAARRRCRRHLNFGGGGKKEGSRRKRKIMWLKPKAKMKKKYFLKIIQFAKKR
jgi:hypothetical protein